MFELPPPTTAGTLGVAATGCPALGLFRDRDVCLHAAPLPSAASPDILDLATLPGEGPAVVALTADGGLWVARWDAL